MPKLGRLLTRRISKGRSAKGFVLAILLFGSVRLWRLGVHGTGTRKELRVVFQSKGEWGQWAVHGLLQRAFPDRQILYLGANKRFRDFDLILEGCPIFQREGELACTYSGKPWIQFSAEPRKHYRHTKWCPHVSKPLLRLDTSLETRGFAENAFDTNGTTTLWTPYACQFAMNFRGVLQDRNVHLSTFLRRPYMLAWLSSNCLEHRVAMWRAMAKVARHAGIHGVHSLGKCANNRQVDLRRGDFYYNSEIYKKYKFVLVMENSEEIGYVTEKIVQVLAAGAIPIYFGHSDSVSVLFNSSSFIDIQQVWSQTLFRVGKPRTNSDWEMIARYVLNISSNARAMQSLLLRNVFSLHTLQQNTELTVFPPECVGSSEVEETYRSPVLQLAIQNLREHITN